METLTITRPQLDAVLLRWEQDYRDGKTRSHEETARLPAETAAKERADYLWSELSATVATLLRP